MTKYDSVPFFSETVTCQFCEIFIEKSSELIVEHSKNCYHVERPNDKYRHICIFCDYHTHMKCHMIDHVRRHIDVKPFECSYCTYRSTTKSNLKKHMKIKHNVPWTSSGTELPQWTCVDN